MRKEEVSVPHLASPCASLSLKTPISFKALTGRIAACIAYAYDNRTARVFGRLRSRNLSNTIKNVNPSGEPKRIAVTCVT